MINNAEILGHSRGKSHNRIKLWLMLLAVISQAVPAQSVTRIIINNQVSDGNNGFVIQGNGVPGKEKREVDAFRAIKVMGAINVNYRRASEVHVEVEADQNLLPIISTKVVQDALTIRATQSYLTRRPVMVEISSPHLGELTLDGSGEISLKGIMEPSLRLDLQGSGSVIAEGQAERFSADVKGSGKVNARELESLWAEFEITGSGAIAGTVKEELQARITGSGEITYFGYPKTVEPNILGSGRIKAGD